MSCVDKFLSNLLFGYRKGYSAQTAHVLMLEKWRHILDKKKYASAILMDLSKAFDTINHELLLVKLYTYGSSNDLLIIILSDLSSRKQRVKINNTLSQYLRKV